MKLPKTINVMGVIYRIRLRRNPLVDGEYAWGFTNYQSALVVLRRGMNPQKMTQTLIHELTHAMIHEMGDDKRCNDETLVNPLGNVLYQVLKENRMEVK